ncbi:MAG: hypothetical protein QM723_40660 [Myxococcaceae bacterium]
MLLALATCGLIAWGIFVHGSGLVFKHAAKIAKVASCPPANASSADRTAYRYVGSKVDATCFRPVAEENPARKFAGVAAQCCGWGLSLWDSIEQARTRYKALIEGHQKLKEKWSNVARVEIKAGDGVHTPSDKHGHFTFFEYATTDLVKASTLGEAL